MITGRMRGPGLSDVRGKWPGKGLVGMNFVGSAKAGGEEAGGARRGTPGRWATSRGAERPRGAAQGSGPPRPRTPVEGRDLGAPRPAHGPARPAAWHSSKRAPTKLLCIVFLVASGPGGMGLAQAVSLPRGGGTLKGQRPLPAAARCRLRPPHLPAARLTPFGDDWRPGQARGERARAGPPGRRRGPGAQGACRGSPAAVGQAASREPAAGTRQVLCRARGGESDEERSGRKLE